MHLGMNGLGSADGFLFYNDLPKTSSDGERALTAAINARFGPEVDLSEDQITKISKYVSILDLIKVNELTDLAKSTAFEDAELDIQIIDDLQTTGGDTLLGFTTTDGRILLDSGLEGDALTAVITEEIAEAAYYDIFADHSKGDFGAEVLARLTGTQPEESLAVYQSVTENDTVLTPFGEGQAAWAPGWAQGQMAQSFHQRNWWDSGFNWASNIETVAAGTPIINFIRKSPDVVTPNTWALNVDPWDGKYDLNNDGILDQYTVTYVGRSNAPLKVDNVRPSKIIPTDQIDTVLFGRGGVSNQWVFKEDRKYSTAETYKINAGVKIGVESSLDVFGLGGVDLSVEFSFGFETSTTVTNEFTVSNEVRKTYQLFPGAYEEGTLVRYGYHMVTADIDVVEEFDVFARIDNAAPGYDQGLKFTATARGSVDNYALGLVATDYDVSDRPDAWEILNIA